MPADERDGIVQMRRILADPAIGPAEVLAPGRPEHLARGLGLLQPLLDRAVAAHLAGGEIAEADAEPERGMARDDAARADFEVVGMRAEDEEINRHGA